MFSTHIAWQPHWFRGTAGAQETGSCRTSLICLFVCDGFSVTVILKHWEATTVRAPATCIPISSELGMTSRLAFYRNGSTMRAFRKLWPIVQLSSLIKKRRSIFKIVSYYQVKTVFYI